MAELELAWLKASVTNRNLSAVHTFRRKAAVHTGLTTGASRMFLSAKILFRALTGNSNKSGPTLAQRGTQGAGGPHVPTSSPLAAIQAPQEFEEPHQLGLPQLSLILAQYIRCCSPIYKCHGGEGAHTRSRSPLLSDSKLYLWNALFSQKGSSSALVAGKQRVSNPS